MWTGSAQEYHWLVTSDPILGAMDLLIEHHMKDILHVTAFDSGPLVVSHEEKSVGWVQRGLVAVSPPIGENIVIPYDQYDEWYFSKTELAFPGEFEQFVNYGAFNLASPKELTKHDDPSWERGRCDYLYPLQERFWAQITAIKPESYLSSGDLDIYVSRNEQLINSIHQCA